MKKFFIAAPFGNYITHKKCFSVCGTFTLHKRGNLLTRIYMVLKTVRPIKGGWVNRIGLQNPGIKSIKRFQPEKFYSITAITPIEWDSLIEIIPSYANLELNLSCPNLHKETEISNNQIRAYLEKYPKVIFKLSPTEKVYEEIDKLVTLGAKYLHIANTIPTKMGGESGERLKKISLDIIRKIREVYPDIKIIGGGGIYSKADLELYKKAGADYFSLATIWFKPWKAFKLLMFA